MSIGGLKLGGSVFGQGDQPVQGILQHTGGQGVDDELPPLLRSYQASPLQQVQVMGDSWFSQVELLSDGACRQVTHSQQLQDGPAGVVIESLEQSGHEFDNSTIIEIMRRVKDFFCTRVITPLKRRRSGD